MAPLIALLRLEPNGRMGAQVTPVGCLVAPTHYSSEHNLCTDVLHHDNTAKALFAGFRFRNFSPAMRTASRRLGANGASRFWYDATMQNCPDSAAERPDTALHRARTRRWASVRLLGTLCNEIFARSGELV